MEIVMKKLQGKRGEIALELGIALLVGTLLFLVVFNIRHGFQTVDMVTDRTNEAVLSVAAYNRYQVFGGSREGEAVARNYNGTAWTREVLTDDVSGTLARSLGASVNGGTLYREGSFRIDALSTSYINSDGGALHFNTTMELTIYLLGGDHLSITVPLEVKTTYEAKF